MSGDWQLRREMCEVGRRVYQRGLVGGTDGNLSVRAGGDRFLISPSGSCIGMLEPGDFVLIDQAGRALAGTRRPSSERWMHLAAYAERPDIMAALHAHPPRACHDRTSDTEPNQVLSGKVPIRGRAVRGPAQPRPLESRTATVF